MCLKNKNQVYIYKVEYIYIFLKKSLLYIKRREMKEIKKSRALKKEMKVGYYVLRPFY